MRRSPSSLRSLLHLSGRLLRLPNPPLPGSPNPPLPSFALSPRPRFLSASPIPRGVARRATNDDDDTLINSLCASASDAPVDSDVWVVFDPVAGRIVIQRPPPPSSSSTEEEGQEREREGQGADERVAEEKAGVKGKGKGKGKGKIHGKKRACAICERDQTERRSVAAARKTAGKGRKKKASYECSFCGEVHSQLWDALWFF